MRQGAGRGDGQAMVEFALVLAVVLTLLLGCTQIGLYALTRGTAITAAERGIYIAPRAAGSPSAPPATADVYSAIQSELQSGIVGARPASMAPVGGVCPPISASWPVGIVYVCSVANPAAGTVVGADRRACRRHRRCGPQRGVRAMSGHRCSRRGEGAQSVVETALVLPFLIVLALGVAGAIFVLDATTELRSATGLATAAGFSDSYGA